MARSKISAKKSTGAPAPRTPFPTATDDTTPRRKTRSSLSNSTQTPAPPPPKTKARTTRRQSKSNTEADENQGISNQECCYLCGNGGNIIDCETCPNTVCFHCIPEISKIKKTVLNTLTFRCSKCQYDTTKSKTAFVGLYKSNGEPFQTTPLKVEIPEYVLQRQKFRTPPVLLLCFRLASLPERGTAPSLTYETLLGAYLSEGDKIHYEDIPFDLSTNNGIRAHNDRLNQIHELIESQEWSHVLLFITTHSDDDRGDLWYGTKVACEIDQFFEHVIGTGTLESLRNITTSCFLFACGALVKYKESFDATKLQVEKFNIDRLFAFSAISLCSIHVFPFLYQFVYQVILSNRDSPQNFERMLSETQDFGKHTSLIVLTPTSSMKFIWTEKSIRPYGEYLPIQCNRCFAIWSWDRGRTTDKGRKFICEGLLEGARCGNEHHVQGPPGRKVCGEVSRGTWNVEIL